MNRILLIIAFPFIMLAAVAFVAVLLLISTSSDAYDAFTATYDPGDEDQPPEHCSLPPR